ncbi:TetR/AcrR family transcriptional regulator C-terminal domain-containing protein [Thermobifida halotolerans]|uniref:TetR/AcrR family transcriptional regulator C-terminal domain-containing protein n=1 Tax=Thermobifida halotolerans TaxID=483545 RepID=A0A399FXQ1_9ACTN|nr:TetR/AcrR family transcriptional regulator [Thermobifida halotolerans]UOE21334.1 TetR/AcrR family transcriptional regulator C-terminal domain-containing protein [Thermobifida halotolerans]
MSVGKINQERREEILSAALDLAESDGLAAVSLRAIGARVGLTPMALYGYFANKDELLDWLVGRVLREVPPPDPEASWRERLLACARGARAAAHRYPRTFPLLLTRPVVLPEAMRVVDPLYEALLDAGIPDERVAGWERMFSTFVLGFAVSEVSGRFGEGNLGTKERRDRLGPGELPAHHRLGEALDLPVDWDAEFEEGLARLVAMVEEEGARAG